MQFSSIHHLILFLCLWLTGGSLADCQAQRRLTTVGRSRATASSLRLLKLPLKQKIDSVLHHLRLYPRVPVSQQQRYARELTVHFAPSGYIAVRRVGKPELRLPVKDYLAQFGNQPLTIQFKGAEVVHYGQTIETPTGHWQTLVTTYRNATRFAANRPEAIDIATVMTPSETAPPTTNYWQIFKLYLSLPKSAFTR
ncbi:hypothetical protein M0L20_17195 [Spirosoma sp. RP8]|uniref:DUF4251 domain-containing protein n=1 Tax=Spirosoma liriopis TaxID=2937440 RepID=A0ABT0HN57_9BACT|nr:hypothetical protein [Spirosoma liriopis]MCK8493605.1 hypothetical protein [Spirosoma liriopis]